MSLFYRLMYAVGFKPWENLRKLPAFEQIDAMFAREEQRRKHPYRTALDLGCGSGNWSIRLAQRGWNVTGVDIVQKAIRDARARAKEADVQARFVQGSITALRAADIGSGFTLVLDFGAVHGLTPEGVRDTAAGVSEVTADDAVLLMYATSPGGWRGPLPRGLSRAEIEDAYAGWTVVDDYPFDSAGLPSGFRKATPRWLRLCRG